MSRHRFAWPIVRFASARDGIAAVEFALLAPVLLLLMMASLGFGYAFFLKLRVIDATSAAAIYAFQNGSTLDAGNLAAFLAKVNAVVVDVSGLTPAPVVSVLVNNAPDAGALDGFYCASGKPAAWSSTGTTVRSCGGNVLSAKFITITVSASQASLFQLDDILPATLLTRDVAVVRLP